MQEWRVSSRGWEKAGSDQSTPHLGARSASGGPAGPRQECPAQDAARGPSAGPQQRERPGRPRTRGGRECAPFLPPDAESSRSSPRDARLALRPAASCTAVPPPRAERLWARGASGGGGRSSPDPAPPQSSPGRPPQWPWSDPGGLGGAGRQARARGHRAQRGARSQPAQLRRRGAGCWSCFRATPQN